MRETILQVEDLFFGFGDVALDVCVFMVGCFFALQARCRGFYLWNADSPSYGISRLFLDGSVELVNDLGEEP
jgi:hypothetical protein